MNWVQKMQYLSDIPIKSSRKELRMPIEQLTKSDCLSQTSSFGDFGQNINAINQNNEEEYNRPESYMTPAYFSSLRIV